MSSRASSRNSGRGVNGAVGGDAGDMPTTRKLSSRAEFAKGNNASFSSSLEVLEHGDTDETQSRSSSRISLGSRSRSNLGSVPPRSDSSLSQRIPTPTKHVSLTAVRRKQEVDSPIEPELDWREFTRSNSRLGLGGRSYTNTFRLTETAEDETHDESEETHKAEEAQAGAVPSDPAGEVTTQMQAMGLNSGGQSQVKESKESSDDDDDDDDDDDSDSEEEPRKAPNELLMEFLDSVMKKEYKTAEKLCRMILIYEPTNQEALTFHPVILEKLQLEQEAAERGEDGSGEGDDNDDDDDDDSDEDDDDEDDDSEEDSSLDNDSSDEDDEEQEENNADNFPEEAEPSRPDSGIGM